MIEPKAFFIPATRLLCILKIIDCLKKKHLDVKDLSREFNTNPRSIYRYLHILEAAGFLLEKDFEGKYFIIKEPDLIENVYWHE